MLDTWAYKNHEPQINDIVVFHHKSKNQDLVKRIVDWPDGVTQKDEQWFLMGGNRKYSRDSRSFGGIEQHQIVGQVKLMLLGIGNNDRLSDNRYLQPVH
ncbi:MAG: S26 family signal peptidase [Candidatus Thiodiazotropha sp.]